MGKKRVELTESEEGILKKYGVGNREISGWMDMSRDVFMNSTAKQRYRRGVACALLHVEEKIRQKL